MEIIKKKIKDLIPDPNNARKHDEKNLAAIKGSLAKFGQQKPIVVSEKNIVLAGNGTLESAKQLGWEEIDCVVTDLDSFNQTAFALADNRTAELAKWDEFILGQTLHSLRENDFDLIDIGFDTSYLDKINDIVNPEPVEGAKELGEEEFQDFDKKCPRCGFEFDEKKE